MLLVKKSGVNSKSNDASGSWDSIHVLEVAESVRKAKYKLTSTIILNLGSNNENVGTLDLNGNMTRQVEMDMPIDGDGSHVSNIGRMVEDMESKMRNLLRRSLVLITWSVTDKEQKRSILEKQRTLSAI